MDRRRGGSSPSEKFPGLSFRTQCRRLGEEDMSSSNLESHLYMLFSCFSNALGNNLVMAGGPLPYFLCPKISFCLYNSISLQTLKKIILFLSFLSSISLQILKKHHCPYFSPLIYKVFYVFVLRILLFICIILDFCGIILTFSLFLFIVFK